MTADAPFTAVLRLGDVKISESELASGLKVELDRFELSRNSKFCYAQIDIEWHQEPWLAVQEILERLGPAIQRLKAAGLVGNVSLDVGFAFSPHHAAATRTIPSRIAETAGRNNIDIDISVYMTENGTQSTET